jgi:hypothetical protein
MRIVRVPGAQRDGLRDARLRIELSNIELLVSHPLGSYHRGLVAPSAFLREPAAFATDDVVGVVLDMLLRVIAAVGTQPAKRDSAARLARGECGDHALDLWCRPPREGVDRLTYGHHQI